MIASLHGIVEAVTGEYAVIEVGGVGYLVFGSSRTLGTLPPVGERVSLAIETHVREDHIHLYGFVDPRERDWFRLLITVQGVGARVALAIQSVLDSDGLATAMAAQDKAAFTRADGVGPKLAARILNELREKSPVDRGVAAAAEIGSSSQAAAGSHGSAREDAISALVNLGYGRSEAFGAVGRASRSVGETAAVEDLIREGLRELGA